MFQDIDNIWTSKIKISVESRNLYSIYIRVMEFNDTFNNISVISWQSVLLVEENPIDPGTQMQHYK
jgi:hypothetical protein